MLDEELDPLDNLIGDVAKEMTVVPTDAGLAARVSMRIAEAGARRPIWSRPWVLVPMASACALVLAVFVARQGAVRLKPDATPDATPVARVAPSAGPIVASGFSGGDPERVALRNPPAPTARLPELLPAAIAPIDVDRLSVQPIVEMSAIDISPIGIDRIEISAMP